MFRLTDTRALARFDSMRTAPPAPPAPEPGGRQATSNRWTAYVQAALLISLALTAILFAADVTGIVRILVTAAAFAFAPGAAILTRWRCDLPAAYVALACSLSLALFTVIGAVIALTRFWHPVEIAFAVGLISAAALAFSLVRGLRVDLPERPSPDRDGLETLGLAAACCAFAPLLALVAWGLSLASIDTNALTGTGLPPHLPIAWFVALAASALSVVISCWTRMPLWIAITGVAATAIILFATVPLITDVPQYAWTYKHVGVARLFDAQGGAVPRIDIYNRWPGFFSMSAIFDRVAHADPLAYAAWFELFFASINAIAIGAVARVLSADNRVAVFTGFAYLITNWVGQGYFAPQAVAFTLDLCIILIVLQSLRGRGRPLHAIAGRLQRFSTVPERRPLWPDHLHLHVAAAIGMVALLDIALVCSHQLTPYMVVLQVGVLTILGWVRPFWLVGMLALFAAAYLYPNLHFIQKNFGFVSSLNVFDNAKVAVSVPTHRDFFYDKVGLLLALALALFALAGFARLVRTGNSLRACLVAAIAAAPFLVMAGQNYGGEAPLRVVLFSSPWLAMLVAGGLATLGPRLRVGGAVVVTAVLLPLFLFAFYGNSAATIFTRDEVRASERFLDQVPRGSVLFLAGEGYPARAGAQYPKLLGPVGDAIPNVLEDPRFLNHKLGAADVPKLAELFAKYPNRGFVVFSRGQEKNAEVYRTLGPGELQKFEHAVAASGTFRPWMTTRDVRIYELVGKGST
jgi:hypothetical protein